MIKVCSWLKMAADFTANQKRVCFQIKTYLRVFILIGLVFVIVVLDLGSLKELQI